MGVGGIRKRGAAEAAEIVRDDPEHRPKGFELRRPHALIQAEPMKEYDRLPIASALKKYFAVVYAKTTIRWGMG
jgi:hypothetical protein